MDDLEVRIRCLEASVAMYTNKDQYHDSADHVRSRAQKFYDFVTTPEMEIS